MDLSTLLYIDSTGFHRPDFQTLLDLLKADYRSIYGDDVYLESDSQDGQWISIQATAMSDCMAMAEAVYNSFIPGSAQGTGLSRLVKINGLTRLVATNSTVDVTLTGTNGTVILNGVVIDTAGNKWNLPASVTIGGSGTVTVTATAQDAGAIQAAIGAVSGIYTPTVGWQSVTNAAAATAGDPVETDAELRARRALSTALPAQTTVVATESALNNVAGVSKAKVYENDTSTTSADGLPPKSIGCVVLGGTVSDIATTIMNKKTEGCFTFGTTSQVVYDSRGVPSTISFSRPTDTPIKVRITLASRAGWSTDYQSQISASLISVISALGIGDDVMITRLYPASYVAGISSTYDITSIEIAKTSGSFATSNIVIAWNELASLISSNITYVVT